MTWHKLGKIFCGQGQYQWMQSHAANPIAQPLDNSLVRIYFNTRDRENRSHIGWAVIDINQPTKILDLSRLPALSPAEPGCFDDSGVSIGCLVALNGQTALYYVGWNLGKLSPWRNAIGLAFQTENPQTGQIEFARYAPGPIMDRDPVDAYNLSYPWVLHDGTRLRMWYGSNLTPTPADLLHVPHVFRHAASADGIHWARDHHTCLGGPLSGDCAFTRPCVIFENGIYKMWYCHRGQFYQIGYAESPDGLNWHRLDDQAGIAPSPDPTAWDHESLAYASIFDHNGQRFMLYNGKNYGATGFGLAVLENGSKTRARATSS